MATKVLWYVSAALCVASVCRAAPGLLRVPKVYNAIINSDDNLTPSRAFPLIQPILHESPLAYPVAPFLYQPHHFPYEDRDPSQEPSSNIEQSENQKAIATELPKQEAEPKKEPKGAPPQKQPPPSDPALPLNENGLPPSLIPVQQYTPKLGYPYEPYNPYTPYYTDPYTGVLLPYSNPYNPYYQPYSTPFGPYLLQPPFYSPLPTTYQRGNPPQPALPPPPQWGGQPGDFKPQGPQREHLGPVPPGQPLDVNIKNNGNKHPSIPDVPPPPLPVSIPANSNSEKKSN